MKYNSSDKGLVFMDKIAKTPSEGRILQKVRDTVRVLD